ncbi:MAG: nucleotidyltransferase family protein [Vampirovibrionales bacterium]|nr:nucleotidyltransferase family protein [Vampirovibrionales bacterium]
MRIVRQYGAYNLRVFGSVAQGRETPDSDVDFLAEFEEGRSILDQIGMIEDLERLLGRSVDVADPSTLHWFVRERILGEAYPL